MECLICCKVYFKGQSHESSADPHFDISTTVSKLFDISPSSWVTDTDTDIDTFDPVSICPDCHKKLGQVHRMLQELDQIQLILKRIKAEVFADLIKSQQNGVELKERSKIVQEICSKQNMDKSYSIISDTDHETLNLFEVKIFGPESNDNDENIKTILDDHIESIDDNYEDLYQPNPALLTLKNLQIILEPLPLLSPFSEGDSFNVKDEAIVNFIQRDRSSIKIKMKTKSSTNNSKLSKRRKIKKLTRAKSKEEPKTKHCSICNITFKRTTGYITHHNKVHKGERPFQCDKCPKNYFSRDHLRKHLKLSHAVGEKTLKRSFQCDKCPKSYSSRDAYNSHIKTSHGVGEKTLERSFQCDRCPKNFFYEKGLKSHLKLHGIGKRVLQCTICSKFSKSPSELDNHMNVVHFKTQPSRSNTHCQDKLDKFVYCDSCPRFFASNRGLKEHVMSQHNGQKFKCPRPDCEKTFNSSDGVRYHVKMVHDKVYKSICQVENCGKEFLTKKDLKTHNDYVHLKIPRVPKFFCDQCPDKKFYKRQMYNEHYYAKHAKGETPYKCKYCSKTFAAKKGLQMHLKLHSGIPDHICEVCGKAYSSLSALNSHVTTTHLTDNDNKKRRRRNTVLIIPNIELEELNLNTVK